MLQDQQVMGAVSRIRQRSERQQDLQKLLGSFVDVGILPQIENVNNQIIYGRRGTGKTHILRVLESKLKENKGNTVTYIDARTLGSTSQFSDVSVPLKHRCICLFRDILAEAYNELLEHIVNEPTHIAENALIDLDALSKSMTEPVQQYQKDSLTTRSLEKEIKDSSIGGAISLQSGPSIKAVTTSENLREKEKIISYHVNQEDKVLFPELHSLLKSVLDKAQTTLYILIDEWSSIPADVQPYLAEFLKRSFLPNPNIVIKIASLEYRTNFGERQFSDQMLGFEVGSDISTALDIDDYYVYDRNAETVTVAFGDMLFKHLRSELPQKYLYDNYLVDSSSTFILKMFANKMVFEELVRASEGVARDLINIFSQAYFAAQRRSNKSIEKKVILEAAGKWFEQDKSKNLDDSLRDVLQKIIEEVIGSRRARSFLLPKKLEKHTIIQRLFDFRVLHLMQRGYADKDNPGIRYNIYTLDYGTYVGLLNTTRQPLGFEMFDGEVPADFIVPFDDKRSIRRIILAEDILTK